MNHEIFVKESESPTSILVLTDKKNPSYVTASEDLISLQQSTENFVTASEISLSPSNTSSGIGVDSPSRTSSPDSLPYSQASSIELQTNNTIIQRLSVTEGKELIKSGNNEKSTYFENITDSLDSLQPIKETVIDVTDHQSSCECVRFVNDIDKDSIISSSDSSLVDTKKYGCINEEDPKIPDGGWGWVVVFSSFVISMVADGISFSFGLLYIEFLYEFEESKSKTAWIGSLFMAVPLLSGPIMSTLVDKYGCRKMTILGGLISGIGFIISSRVKSIEVMFVTFGLIAGLGLGLCYVTAVVSIAYWFDKKRTLATGLGACGTGIGTFLYAPMTQYFIGEFGWRGTTLLLAGTFLNMCVCGCLMRDPEWFILEQNKQAASVTKSIRAASSYTSISRKSVGTEANFPGVDEIRELLKKGQTPEYILTTLATSMENYEQHDNSDRELNSRSVINLPTYIKQSEKVPYEVLEQLSSNKHLYNVILENYPSLLLCRSTSDKGLNKIGNSIPSRVLITMSMKVKPTKPQAEPIAEEKPLDEEETIAEQIMPLIEAHNKNYAKNIQLPSRTQTVFTCSKGMNSPTEMNSGPWTKKNFVSNTNYLKNIRVHRNSVMYRGAMLNIKKYRLRASSCPNIYRNSMITISKDNEQKWYTEYIELMKETFDFSMFLEFHFLLVSLSTILLFIWFIIPYFYLAEHLLLNGKDENYASRLLSTIGIMNAIGMVGLGWAGDQPWMNVEKTFAWCLIACGISTAAMPIFTNSSVFLYISCIIFGLTFASSYSFIPAILIKLMPIDQFTTAYGLSLMCQGIGNLIGPPLAGLIYDFTHTWDQSFYQAGFWIIISGILILIVPYTNNRVLIGNRQLAKDAESTS